MQEQFWNHGPSPGALYGFPGHAGGKVSAPSAPTKHTLQPMVTGTSVLGVKFNGGVMLAADMVGSYGSMARFRNVSRMFKVTDNIALSAAGDIADFQFLKDIIEQKIIDDECLDDGHGYTPQALFSWLTRVMYNRRSKYNPLWNVVVLGGFHKGESFLGYVDKIGVAYESPTVANGFGAYIALPIMRDACEKNPNMSEADAKALIERCMRILFYRDARSFNKYEITVITKDGVRIEPPTSATTDWSIAHMVEGYE